jgi:raffinose/stachyose/melibiose transport system substrate-binding protein
MARDPSLDIDFMSIPGNDKGKTVANFNVGCYRVVNAKTKHPAEAKKFLAFMHSADNLVKMSLTAKAYPPLSGITVTDPVLLKVAAVVTRPDAVLYWPHTVSAEALQTKILEGVNKYLAGTPLDQALAEMQKAIDEARVAK